MAPTSTSGESTAPLNVSDSVGPYVVVTLLVAVWQGMLAVIVKWVSWPAMTMVWARCVITALVLLAFQQLMQSRIGLQQPVHSTGEPAQTRSWASQQGTIWLGGILLAAHWVTLFWGYRVAAVGPVVVALFTFPLMAVLIEPWIEQERPSPGRYLSAISAVTGVGLMRLLDPGVNGSTQNTTLGIVLGLASAAFYTFRSIISRRMLRHTSAINIMQQQATVVAILLLPSVLWLEPTHLNQRDLTWIAILGVAFTAVPHTLGVWAMRRLSVAASSVVGSLQTVSSIVLAMLLLDETSSWAVWLGAATVTGAVVVESITQWKLPRPTPNQ